MLRSLAVVSYGFGNVVAIWGGRPLCRVWKPAQKWFRPFPCLISGTTAAAVDLQLKDNVFFDHLKAFSSIRKHHDVLYATQAFPDADDRTLLEKLHLPDLFQNLAGTGFNPEMRQKREDGIFIDELPLGEKGPCSEYLQELCCTFTTAFLREIDSVLAQPDVINTEKALCKAILERVIAPSELIAQLDMKKQESMGSLAIKLALLVRKRRAKPIKTEPADTASALWPRIVARTDRLYCLTEKYLPAFEYVANAVSSAAGPTGTTELVMGSLKDPVRVHEKAMDDYGDRFDDNVLPEACVADMIRACLVCGSGQTFVKVLELLNGFRTNVPGFGVVRIDIVRLKNKFAHVDPSHFRNMLLNLHMVLQPTIDSKALDKAYALAQCEWEAAQSKFRAMQAAECSGMYGPAQQAYILAERKWVEAQEAYQVGRTSGGIRIFVELQLHHKLILKYNDESHAHDHYDFFRAHLANTYETRLPAEIDYRTLMLVLGSA